MNYLLPLLIQLSVIAVICQCKSVKHNGHKQSYLNVHRGQRQALWGPLQPFSDFETYQDTEHNDYLRQRKKIVLMEIFKEMRNIELKLRRLKKQPTYTPFAVPCPVAFDALSFDRNKKSSGKTVHEALAQPDQGPISKMHSSTRDPTKAYDPQLSITLNDRGNFQSDDEQLAEHIERLHNEFLTSRKLQRHVRHTSTDFGMPQFTYPQDYFRIYREGKLLSEIITSLMAIRQELARRNEQRSLSYSTPYPSSSNWAYSVPYSTSPCVANTANSAAKKTDTQLFANVHQLLNHVFKGNEEVV